MRCLFAAGFPTNPKNKKKRNNTCLFVAALIRVCAKNPMPARGVITPTLSRSGDGREECCYLTIGFLPVGVQTGSRMNLRFHRLSVYNKAEDD